MDRCLRTLRSVYDPEDEPDTEAQPAYDWDAWEKNRLSGRGRWWLLVAVAVMVAMTALYFQSGGSAIPWGPPG